MGPTWGPKQSRIVNLASVVTPKSEELMLSTLRAYMVGWPRFEYAGGTLSQYRVAAHALNAPPATL